MARILMVSSEATPFATTGGLADVVGSLPREMAALGHHMAVLIPRYGKARLAPSQPVWENLTVTVGPHRLPVSIWQAEDAAVPTYFLECLPLFDRAGIYGEGGRDYDDNHLRFALLSKAAFDVARYLFPTDIFHCHDWQTGLLPVYLHAQFSGDPHFLGCKTVMTIHNLGYRGLYGRWAMAETGLPDTLFAPDKLEFHGSVSYLKAGLVYADAITTVSPTYAKEIQTPAYGEGLDGLLRARHASFTGILNGADYGRWNPETDPMIAATYSAKDLSGKRACKQALLREFGLPEEAMERPLLGIVSRFAEQKGFELIGQVFRELFREDISLIVLGSGDSRDEGMFHYLAATYPDRARVYAGYNEALSHRIEAGSDIFLMPSKYEPCGLNQIYSLRYGTPPLVRATGGLADSVDEETGFRFNNYNGWELLGAIQAALVAFQDRRAWQKRMKLGMRRDFSWGRSAREYSKLYNALRPDRAVTPLNPATGSASLNG